MSPKRGRLQGVLGGGLYVIGATDLQRAWVVSPDYRMLIDALALRRREEGVSQRELARRIGKPPSFINKIELLERRLDILEFIVIAEALGDRSGNLLAALRSNLADHLRLP